VKSFITILMLLAPLAAHGQLLKCVSKDGKVEYAAQCPPGTKQLQTGIKSEPAKTVTKGEAQPKTLAEREAEFKKRQLEATESRQKENEKAAERAFNREACENAQSHLKGLQEGQRIVRVDPRTGDRVFMEDMDRPAEIAKAQKVVSTNCK
jgi:Skp family chaperone for outer membrane proteins